MLNGGIMLIIRAVRVNPKYIKPKYGRGIFSSFVKLISKTASSVAKNQTLRKGLNAAISGGKQALKKATTEGKQLARNSIKKGYLKKGLEAVVDTGTQLALNHVNKGIDSSADILKKTIDNKLSEDSPLRHISNSFVDSVKEKAKEVGEKSANRLGKEILKRAVDQKGYEKPSSSKNATTFNQKQQGSNKKAPHTSSKGKRSQMISNATQRTGSKRKIATVKTQGTSKRRKKINWNDVSLNSLIARQ